MVVAQAGYAGIKSILFDRVTKECLVASDSELGDCDDVDVVDMWAKASERSDDFNLFTRLFDLVNELHCCSFSLMVCEHEVWTYLILARPQTEPYSE